MDKFVMTARLTVLLHVGLHFLAEIYKICFVKFNPLKYTLGTGNIVSTRPSDRFTNSNRKSLESRLRPIER